MAGWILALVLGLFLAAVLASRWSDMRVLCRATVRVGRTGDGLKLFAFLGATGAGMALTLYLIWNTAYLHAARRDDNVFVLAVGAMVLLGFSQLSLHRLLGAKQAIEIEFWKLKAKMEQGGD